MQLSVFRERKEREGKERMRESKKIESWGQESTIPIEEIVSWKSIAKLLEM